MERVITIDIKDKYDLVEKYDESKTSRELLKYVIDQALLIEKEEKLKIIINNKAEIRADCEEMLKAGLKDEYTKSINERGRNNARQIFFFLLGVLFIFLSSLIKQETIWKEILLISGWVPIWEMVEVELFPDTEGRRKRKVIRKLLKAQIIENNGVVEEDLQ